MRGRLNRSKKEVEGMDGSIIVLIGVVGTICSIVFGYAGYLKGIKTEAADDGTLRTDTQYIKRRIDDVLLEQRSINTTLGAHSERITRVEESSKQAHKRIDRLESAKEDTD